MNTNRKLSDDLNIDPSTIIMRIGYLTSLCVLVGWAATLLL